MVKLVLKCLWTLNKTEREKTHAPLECSQFCQNLYDLIDSLTVINKSRIVKWGKVLRINLGRLVYNFLLDLVI